MIMEMTWLDFPPIIKMAATWRLSFFRIFFRIPLKPGIYMYNFSGSVCLLSLFVFLRDRKWGHDGHFDFIIFKSPPTMWWWRLIVFAESAASPPPPTCFCSHSKTLTQIISKYLQYAYWPWGICLVNCFLRFLVFSTKSKIAAKILWRMLELEPLYRFVSCLV